MKNTALTFYRRLIKAVAEVKGESVLSRVDKARLREVMRRNRDALAGIENWLPDGLIEKSIFRYGVNPEVKPFLNLPLDGGCTHADLLAYLGSTGKTPCKYLELGVSVGKTLWQMVNTCAPCECWGFDIEELTPTLKQRFVEQSREEWPTPAKSIKKTPSSISQFIHPPSGSRITYICADIFDERAWQFLAGKGFNVVLSDALHTPEALDFEWQQMTALNIFHSHETAVMWDDLNGEMRDWFQDRRDSIAAHFGVNVECVSTLFVNGWLGKREFPHRLGLALRNVLPS